MNKNMKGLITMILLAATAASFATQISKHVKLKHVANGNIREFVLLGRLKLPESVGITYNSPDPMVLTLTGDERDVKSAEKAIADLDILPKQVIVSCEFSLDGKVVSKPIVRTLVGYNAKVNEDNFKHNLKKLSLELVPRISESGDIRLQTSITVNDIVLVVPTGIMSGDSFSYSASKAAYYLRWTRAGKTIAEYPVPEAVTALGNTKVTISFKAVEEA